MMLFFAGLCTTPILGCITEQDVKYLGNDTTYYGNYIQGIYSRNVESCRSICHRVDPSHFFSWSPDGMCFCTGSDAKRIPMAGYISGRTSCRGKLLWGYKCMIFGLSTERPQMARPRFGLVKFVTAVAYLLCLNGWITSIWNQKREFLIQLIQKIYCVTLLLTLD